MILKRTGGSKYLAPAGGWRKEKVRLLKLEGDLSCRLSRQRQQNARERNNLWRRRARASFRSILLSCQFESGEEARRPKDEGKG